MEQQIKIFMALKIKNEFKIGVMVAVAIVFLILGLNYLKGNNLFSTDQEFYTIYSNVQGLQESAVVQINGFDIGKVTSIELQPDKKIKVKFTVKEQINVPQGSYAKLSTNDFISGAKIIELDLVEKGERFESGSFIPGKESEGILDNISETMAPLVGSVRNTLMTLDTLIAAVNNVLNEETQAHLNNSFASLDVTLKQLSHLSTALSQQSDNLNGVMVNARSLTENLANNNERISNSFNNFETFTNKLNNTDIDKTLNNLETASEDLKTLANRANDSTGSLGMVLSDKALYYNLTSSLSALDTLLTDVKKHPAKYINISVFGSKERK